VLVIKFLKSPHKFYNEFVGINNLFSHDSVLVKDLNDENKLAKVLKVRLGKDVVKKPWSKNDVMGQTGLT
jgi:hypothetical protein